MCDVNWKEWKKGLRLTKPKRLDKKPCLGIGHISKKARALHRITLFLSSPLLMHDDPMIPWPLNGNWIGMNGGGSPI